MIIRTVVEVITMVGRIALGYAPFGAECRRAGCMEPKSLVPRNPRDVSLIQPGAPHVLISHRAGIWKPLIEEGGFGFDKRI